MTNIQIEAVFEDVLEKDVFQSKNSKIMEGTKSIGLVVA
jgi:hypothetical protein